MTWFNAATEAEAHNVLARLGRDTAHPAISTRHLGEVQSGGWDVTQSAIESLWGDHHEHLTEEQERTLVTAHQAGSTDATELLLRAFMPVLKRLAMKYRKSGFVAGYRDDDVRQHATLGFLEALDQTPPGELVRKRAVFAVLHALEEVGFIHRPISIPKRTRQRFVAIMSKAESDPFTAAQIAPENGMSIEVFWMCFRAANFEDQYSSGQSSTPNLAHDPDNDDPADAVAGKRESAVHEGYDNIDDRLTVAALQSGAGLDCRERQVLKAFSYGWTDAQTATLLNIDRTRVVHIRAAALAKMRQSAGAGEEN